MVTASANSQTIDKVLITGANGFVGSHLSNALKEQNIPIIRSVRQNKQKEGDYVITDLNSQINWEEALKGVSHVVHLAARVHVLQEVQSAPLDRFRSVNVEGTVNLAKQAMQAGVKRFIFISTIGVHGVKTYPDRPFTEQSPCQPINDYALSKLEAEQQLQELTKDSPMELVILRPPIVYGEGVVANFLSLLKFVNRALPLPFDKIHNKRDMLYVGNFVEATIACLTHPNVVGKIFLLSDNFTISTTDLLNIVARYMHKPSRLFYCPPAILMLIGKITRRSGLIHRLEDSLTIDSSYIRKELNWQPSFSFDEGIENTVNWFVEHKNLQNKEQ